ncbi:hypothetical protein [Flavobacterium sp. 3HN19-14]|uniref:hypothetical protein n=1 Tax=Flavobacterium sp. 3HN19-14 TaxID=3448133 RepID=UPI003EE38777
MKNIVFILLLCASIAGCEGSRVGEGHIYESETNIVLDSVAYKAINDETLQYTDSTGHYYVTGPSADAFTNVQGSRLNFQSPAISQES